MSRWTLYGSWADEVEDKPEDKITASLQLFISPFMTKRKQGEEDNSDDSGSDVVRTQGFSDPDVVEPFQ